jgi:hypothetical protein
MQTSTQPQPQPTAKGVVAGGSVLPTGALRWVREYFVGNVGRMLRAADVVPVDQFGHIVGEPYRCRKCEPTLWYPAKLNGVPICPVHNRRMEKREVKKAFPIPVAGIWSAVERPLRPVWALPAMAAAGWVVAAGHVPALALAGAAPLIGVGAALVARRSGRIRGWLGEHANLDAAVARAARSAGALAAAGLGWLALAAGVGLSGHGWLAEVALWGPIAGLWLLPAATWWKRLRIERRRPKPVHVEPVRVRSADELDAATAAETWRDDVAVEGTKLDEATWQRIPCGWQAVVVATKKGALNPLGGDLNQSTVRRVAAAYDVPFSAVTWIEAYNDDPAKEQGSPNRALLLVQPSNPLAEGQAWAGPSTIDVPGGRQISGRLITGEVMWEPWYRFGWGAPSEIVLGSTGAGKSGRLRKKMVAERWTYRMVDGVPRGLFVTLLHDPKRLESYAEFRDAVHGYGITRDDAHIIIDALLREMFRRYDFISALEWTDGKNRRRRGGLAWNPLVHGPIISHYWDEFHELASDGPFVAKLEKLARYQRAAAMRGTLASHMGTLSDTGSQALRDMLAGGRATLFRTTSALNAGLVSGGQLTADPRTLPRTPGMCYVVDGETAPIMGRESYIPGGEEPGNVYDWLFNDANEPIGFPAEIPPETAEAFGPEFMQWLEAGRAPGGRVNVPYVPDAVAVPVQAPARPDVRCVDAVLAVLAFERRPLDRNELVASLNARGNEFATRTLTGAVKELKAKKKAMDVDGRLELTPACRAEFDALEQERAAVAAEERVA